MNKKGFTLVEIIAVIVILAVIIALVVPLFSGNLFKQKNLGGIEVEKVLVDNLKAYNIDKESQIWNEKNVAGDCYVMSPLELMSFNPDINLGDCLINSFDSLIIQKTDNGYGYYAGITCNNSFVASDDYLVGEQNTDGAYYRSINEYNCNNLD